MTQVELKEATENARGWTGKIERQTEKKERGGSGIGYRHTG